MAKGGGIWRTIRLALDRNSAKRMQAEAQAALKGATDPKAAKANLKKANSYFAETEAAVKKVGAAIVAAFAFRKIVGFFSDSIHASNEAAKVWRVLGASVTKAGVDFARVRPDLEKAAKALQAVTSIDDEGFATILQELISKTGDFEKSLKNVDLTARVAATFFGGDFAAAAEVVGKALNGNMKGLNLLVGASKNAEEGLKKLSDRSTHDVDQFKQVSNAWNDIKEAIGDALKTAAGGPSVMQQLIGVLQTFGGWVKDNEGSIKSFASAVGSVVTWFIEMVGGLKALNFQMASLFSWTGLKRRGGASPATPSAPAAATGIAQLNPLIVEAHARTAAEKAAIVKRVTEAAKVAQAARMKAALSKMPSLSGGMQNTISQGPIRSASALFVPDPEAFQRATDVARAGFKSIEDSATGAAYGISGAFQDAFSLMLEGFDNIGNAAAALGKGIAGALLGGVAQYAGSKVAENIAFAFEEVAKGIAAASSILLAGTAPGHFAAAKAHGFAAAKWAVLAGGAGAAQSAVSGGGRGGQSGGIPSGARDPGGRLNETLQTQPTVVNVYIDPLNPSDPAYQRNVHAAGQYARERFGDNAVVSVHPRTGK